MHTATYLDHSQFAVTIDHQAGDLAALLPDWQPHDRLGIVVDRPFGLSGASLLIQAASLLFYEAKEQRRWALKQYPEIYAFLLDGPHGELGAFDFAPSRKEVLLPRDPSAVVAAIHDRAITRLVVVDGPPSTHQFGFDEINPGLDRITSAFAYSPSGRTTSSDVQVRGSRKLEWNVDVLLDTEQAIAFVTGLDHEGILAFEPQLLDPDFGFDRDGFVEYMRSRADEVPSSTRARIRAERDRVLVDGVPTETYRRLSVADALARVVPSAAPSVSG